MSAPTAISHSYGVSARVVVDSEMARLRRKLGSVAWRCTSYIITLENNVLFSAFLLLHVPWTECFHSHHVHHA